MFEQAVKGRVQIERDEPHQMFILLARNPCLATIVTFQKTP